MAKSRKSEVLHRNPHKLSTARGSYSVQIGNRRYLSTNDISMCKLSRALALFIHMINGLMRVWRAAINPTLKFNVA
jgi:hypothetical protein